MEVPDWGSSYGAAEALAEAGVAITIILSILVALYSVVGVFIAYRYYRLLPIPLELIPKYQVKEVDATEEK